MSVIRRNYLDKLNDKQKLCFNQILEGKNVFITGSGGTGKTYLLKVIKEYLDIKYKDIPYKHAITSLTGISSTYLDGTTIHSWSGIGLGNSDIDILIKRIIRSGKVIQWRTIDILLIDEISMLDAKLFTKLHYIGCQLRNCQNKLYGGIQLILAGDFLQLPPIDSSGYCFESLIWNEYKDDIDVINFTKIIRQSDFSFQKLLQNARMGIITDHDDRILEKRIITKVPKNESGIKATLIFPKNYDVDQINDSKINQLISKGWPSQLYKPNYSFIREENDTSYLDTLLLYQIFRHYQNNYGDENEKKRFYRVFPNLISYLDKTHKTSLLTENSQVMLTYNIDIDKKLVNGSRGIIIRFQEKTNYPIVKFVDGQESVILPQKHSKHFSNFILITNKIPLIPAWATTIHKQQGATLNYAIADLSEIFSPGQAYVALSRITSLDGLYLFGYNRKKIYANKAAIEFYKKLGFYCRMQRIKECADKDGTWVDLTDKNNYYHDACNNCFIDYLKTVMTDLLVEKITDNLLFI